MFQSFKTAVAGAQILFVAFGAMVLVPLLTGLNPAMALLGAGIGTLLFQALTGRKVPIFLGSSFAFIAPIIYAMQEWGMGGTMFGLFAAGFMYFVFAALIKYFGLPMVSRLLPPVVIGPVIMVIGLSVAVVASSMAMGQAGGNQVLDYTHSLLLSELTIRQIINFQNNLKMMNDDPASQNNFKMTDDTPASQENMQSDRRALIEMHHVNVGWDGHAVLSDLNWTLYEGEHWLIRGPNGSGKTTFLELITGDNMQVYSNDVRVFGSRRGSGETMWDIKAKLGIVSYRMHVEYRMLGGTALRDVVVSGFRDSIGLYGKATDMETAAAERWLSLGGFSGRGNEAFSALSYGEQRAVLILRAAVKCPLILVLDEPCHGLDENHRRRVLDLLETIAESGTTTLLHVTHESDETLACEKHILELHPGKTPMYKIVTI